MANTIFRVTQHFTVKYDPASKEFQDTLKDYKESIDKKATEKSMLKQVVWHIAEYGGDRMIEGVGYIKMGDKKPLGKPYSGIEISEGEKEVE